eukprot:7030431-Alexandrium_andersonii.AAC.1
MSASLVGSEMCIRDSRRLCDGRPDVALPVARQCRWADMDNVNAGVAVSYTHLTLPTICSV